MKTTVDYWLIVGFFGQLLFSSRFLVQWIASEKRKESVIPVSFWFFSLGGSLFLLSYAIHKADPVFIVGQSAGFIIYLRNLYFINRKRKIEKKRSIERSILEKERLIETLSSEILTLKKKFTQRETDKQG